MPFKKRYFLSKTNQENAMNMQKLKADAQYLLPKHLLTRAVGFAAGAKLGKVTTFMIQQFIKHYGINTKEMSGKIEDYKSFNAFFSRPLVAGARPINPDTNVLTFPVDGKISQFGKIEDKFLFQAKNHYYTTEALLADSKEAQTFKNGDFITIYLSPKDYHRVHLPFAGTLDKMIHVPGDLFSVNPFNAVHIPELFARNERVVCFFNTEIGRMAVIFVGATIVRSISTAWAGTIAPNKNKDIAISEYAARNLNFAKGDEIGKFFMGSTVICLFEKDKIQFTEDMQAGQPTRMGMQMATVK